MLSLERNDLALLHLLIHIVSKTLLLICTRIIIHIFENVQDIRIVIKVQRKYVSSIVYNLF